MHVCFSGFYNKQEMIQMQEEIYSKTSTGVVNSSIVSALIIDTHWNDRASLFIGSFNMSVPLQTACVL